MKLIAPGHRKNNKFWVMRAVISSRQVEISTKCTNRDDAQRIAEKFVQRAQEVWGEDPSVADRVAELLTQSLEEVIAFGKRAECGIYFLLRRDQIQYIGQSARVASRIKRHREDRRIEFDNWVTLACMPRDLNLLEAAYIHRYQPPLNLGFYRPRNPIVAGRSPPGILE